MNTFLFFRPSRCEGPSDPGCDGAGSGSGHLLAVLAIVAGALAVAGYLEYLAGTGGGAAGEFWGWAFHAGTIRTGVGALLAGSVPAVLVMAVPRWRPLRLRGALALAAAGTAAALTILGLVLV